MECKWLDCEIYDDDVENICALFDNLGQIDGLMSYMGKDSILNKDNIEFYNYLKDLCDKYDVDCELTENMESNFYIMSRLLYDFFYEMIRGKFDVKNL